jgi:cyanophycin synthetase
MMGIRAALKAVELGGAVGAWRELVARLELVRATGPRHALRRLSQDLRRAGEDKRIRLLSREMWAAAAEALGAEIVDLGAYIFEIRKGDSYTRVWEGTPTVNDDVAAQLTDDKAQVYRLLRAAGVPVPDHVEFSRRDIGRAKAFLHDAAPCVIKPTRSASGFGVTSQLRKPAELRSAARWAGRFSERLLIERQTEGTVYRLLVLDGTIVDVIRRQPPRVTGDGRSTIAELVEAEYERRIQSRQLRSVRPFVIDLDCVLTLRSDGLSPRSVLAAGTTVRLKTVTNQNRREDNETALDTISNELAADALAAASATRLRFAGIDVVTPDEGKPLAQSGGVVIDVNASPGLWHHYHVRDPSGATDVAVEILRRLLSPSQ